MNCRSRIYRIGETRVMNNGLSATIIEYDGFSNIKIRFKNGATRKTKYKSFVNGNVLCPMISDVENDYIRCINPNTDKSFIVDKSDADQVLKSLWQVSSDGYVGRAEGRLHRLLLNVPRDLQVDHINGDRSDNRRLNLRICTREQNSRNRKIPSNNISGYKGVYFRSDKKQWMACIRADGIKYHLGYFETREDAALAYNDAAVKYHSEFARLNNISEISHV